jgi:drug/metabolite transporter (DMT)-like permease
MNWILLALLAAVTFSIQEILKKKFVNKNTSPSQLTFEQYLLFFVLSTIFFWNKINFNDFYTYYNLFLAKAFTLFLFTTIYLYLLKTYEISKLSPLLNLSPLILIIFSSVFLGEVITYVQFLGILLIIIGTYILEIHIKLNKHKEPHKTHLEFIKKIKYKDLLLIFSLLFIISMTAIIDKTIFKNGVNVETNLFGFSFLIILFMSIYYLYKRELWKRVNYIIKEPETTLIGIFSFLSAIFILKAISMPSVLVSLVVPLKRVSTVFTAIIGGFIFGEKHLIRKFFSILIMLIGIYLISL